MQALLEPPKALGLFLGGIGRVISMEQSGPQEGYIHADMILELAMPIFFLWQWLLAGQASFPRPDRDKGR
ncbi:MAG: hypothetical protein AAF941_00945 [Pseudomonadota bacterium]